MLVMTTPEIRMPYLLGHCLISQRCPNQRGVVLLTHRSKGVIRCSTLLQNIWGDVLEGHTSTGQVGLALQQVEVLRHEGRCMHQTHGSFSVVLHLRRV